jgi:hypothetical protein
VGEEHVLLEHAVVGVDHRKGAGRGVGGGDRGDGRPGDARLVAGGLGGVEGGAATDPDHDVGRALLGDLGDAIDLPVGADAPEGLALELDAGLLERVRELVASQLPHVLVRDHQRLPADLGHVLPDGGEHPAALDVAAGGDERLDRPGVCHGLLPSEVWRSGHLRLAG